MMAVRASVSDFIAAVQARGSGNPAAANNVWALLNADGSVSVTVKRNGTFTTYQRIVWPGNSVAAATDASGGNQDTINIYSPDGTVSTVSAQAFISGLLP